MSRERISGDERCMHGVRIARISAEILYEATNCGGNGCAVDAERRLRGGDQLAKQPEQTNVTVGDVDEALNFVVGR